MRLRRIEFIAIALTFAFVCFMGGYFAGSKGAVNIVAVEPQYGETQQIIPVPPQAAGAETVSPGPAAPSSPDGTDPSGMGSESPAADTKPVIEQPGAPRGGDGRININSATRSELTDLPGIGDVLAGRIVDYRNQNGAFSRIEDIKNVSGIADKRFEAIKDKITVG